MCLDCFKISRVEKQLIRKQQTKDVCFTPTKLFERYSFNGWAMYVKTCQVLKIAKNKMGNQGLLTPWMLTKGLESIGNL